MVTPEVAPGGQGGLTEPLVSDLFRDLWCINRDQTSEYPNVSINMCSIKPKGKTKGEKIKFMKLQITR